MNDLEKYLNSSLNKMKKAILTYNNFYEPDRVENFIIFSHIAFNKLFIAYGIKNNLLKYSDNSKGKTFDQLKQMIASKKVFKAEEIKYIEKLNSTRNEIHHKILDDAEPTIDINNYKFLLTLVSIYRRIFLLIENNINLKENILIMTDFKTINNDKNWYLKDISKLIKESPINDSEGIALVPWISSVGETLNEAIWKKPAKATELIKQEIPDFSLNAFTNIRKCFLIINNSWEKLDIKKDFDKFANNEKYSYKFSIEKVFYYHIDYVNKVIDICKKTKDYKNFFQESCRQQNSFDIENFNSL